MDELLHDFDYIKNNVDNSSIRCVNKEIENNNEEKNDFWNFMRSSSYCRINIC